ncbi:MAG: hypothetical protein B7Y88_11560 [Sphingomonadales bacterium 32-64-17]|nr:MAG: hypothetical protein B7Y88_11560 [Sphingomonadales bacterium 32-64-17]
MVFDMTWRGGTACALRRLAALMIVVAALTPVNANARTRTFSVPVQSASEGVRDLARQAGIQIIVAGSQAAGRVTREVRGRMEVRDALEALLAGTGLVVRSFNGRMAILGPASGHDDGVRKAQAIVVTGTRIARPDLQSVMPVSTVDMREAERFGRTGVYDALIREPSVGAGSGLNTAFGQPWDAGVASISLRSLGANRSLTLVDGMRRVSGSARSSAVDINMIPAAMVDHIEIITGGATAIYGADAVTGAVNVVTRFDLDRPEFAAKSGISQEGDASEHTASLTAGGTFSGGRWVLGGTWSRVAPLSYSQRYDIYIRNAPNPLDTGPNDGIPDQITAHDFRQIYYAYEPSFHHDGRSYIVENGAPRLAGYDRTLWPGEFSFGNGGDGRNLRDADQLRGGLGAVALIGRAEVDLTDYLELGGYLEYGRTRYDGTAGVPLHRDDSRSTWFSGAGGSVARTDNPFVPAAVRQFMIAEGLDTLNISRTFGNFPEMRERHDRASLTFGQSLRGPLAPGLEWRVFHQYGRTADEVQTTNMPRLSRWLAARDAVADPVSGDPVCRSAAARAEGCTPLDIFSLAPPTAQLKSYVLDTREEERVNTQRILGANVTGTIFALPHGDISAVIGFEHRRETLRTLDDPLVSELAYDGSGYRVHPELDVSFTAAEAYGELVVPMLRGLPFAERLEIEGAYRHSRYSMIGSTDTWKLGGAWSPRAGLELRAVRSRSVRAPNFGELYEPAVGYQMGSITDPCEAGDYHQSARRAANCLALGIATPLGDFKVGPLVTTSGNPGLRPETSDSMTIGLVLGRGLIPRFEASVDYWDIRIADAILQHDYTTVLNLCVDLPSIDNIFCRAVARDPADGRVVAVETSQINASKMLARGIDLGARYDWPGASGTLAFRFKGTLLLQHTVETTPGISSGDVRYHGDWQHPRFRGNLVIRYEAGASAFGIDTRFISASRYDVNAASPETYEDNSVPPMIYNDLFLSHDLGPHASVLGGVRNLWDRRPPNMFVIYKDGSVYDTVGRYLYVGVNLNL